jgi:hypothetical protein
VRSASRDKPCGLWYNPRMPHIDLRPQQRAALVAWHLAHGEGLRTADVARMMRLTRQGAFELLSVLSVVLPIYEDDDNVWQVCAIKEDGCERQ